MTNCRRFAGRFDRVGSLRVPAVRGTNRRLGVSDQPSPTGPVPSRWSLAALAMVPVFLLVTTMPVAAAVSASVVGNRLEVTSDAASDVITLRLLAGDSTQLEVLSGAAVVSTVSRLTFTTILVDGGGGDDTILIDDANGPFTDLQLATLNGGDGNDTITGGAGAETISGGAGNDTLLGRAGTDLLQGGDGNDTLTGGPGIDVHQGGLGDDLLIWNPGDGNDVMEGEGGTDTHQFSGSAGNEVIAVSPNGQRVGLTRDVGNIVMDIGTTENLVVTALGGNDTLSAGTGLAGLIAITFDGGDGDDTITGGDGNDVLLGGAGVDTMAGGEGNDTITPGPGNETSVTGGSGDDVLIWNPGDGSDVMDGEAGTDTHQFNGSAGNEVMAASANGQRVTFTRDLGNIVMSLGTFETLVVTALGGNDTLSAGTGLAGLIAITLDGGEGDDTITGGDGNDVLRGGAGVDTMAGGDGNDTITPGPGNETSVTGGAGDDVLIWNPGDGSDVMDGEAGTDTHQFNGSAGNEVMAASANGQRVAFTRDLGNIVMSLGTFENLVVTALGGNDTLSAGAGLAGLIAITLDGGEGDDTITGGDGNDVLLGGPGVDTIAGGAGDDTITGGTGNDSVSGGPGNDRMIWNNGDNTDVNEGEAGTDTTEVNGSTTAGDVFTIAPHAGRVKFDRTNLVPFSIDIGTVENVVLNGLGGDDSITAAAGLAGVIALTINGGDGNDTVTGGDGNDTLLGGPGLDTIAGGAGDDTITGGTGNDSVSGGPGNDRMIWNNGDNTDVNEGEGGTDTTEVNGSTTAGDVFTIAPNNTRVKFDRTNLVPFSIDIGTVENVVLNGLGGDDSITAAGGLANLVALTIDGGAGADTLGTAASTTVVVIGGSEADTLNFNAEGQAVTLVGSTIAVGGQTRATFSQVETVTVTNAPSAVPTISVTAPPTTSTSPFLTVNGTASDDASIASVTWVNDRGGSGTATGTTNWSATNIPLQAGANVVSVTVQDASGSRVTTSFTVTVTSFSYYLAEGATGDFFDLDVLIANPTTTAAPIVVTFLKDDGTTVTRDFTVAPTSQLPISVEDILGPTQAAVSTIVTSTNAIPLVVERTMQWDGQRYGSHGGTAVDGPRTRWVFAEGSQGFFTTYVLLANANSATANVTVSFLLENGAPVQKKYDVAPTSRFNVFTGAIPELANQSFSIVVDSNLPIIAERAMYFGTARFWDGGHESAGVGEGATSWFLAEGATGSFFDTFVLVGNPNAVDTNVTLIFLTDGGTVVTRQVLLGANRRLTVNIEDVDPLLRNVAVATTVTADQPVVVERAMYWPGIFTSWYEAHNSLGVTELGTKWGLSEGRVGFPEDYETYILLANPSTSQSANVKVTFLRASGAPVVKTYTVTPTTRFNVHVNGMVPELANETFGALIEVTNGVGIAVERAMYSDALGQTWGAGTNAPATRLP